MNRIILSLLLAVALPASAQTVNPAAKVDPKNNKVSKPVEIKPKQKLMSRDELRSCLQQLDTNNKEAAEIKTAQADFNKERSELVASRTEMENRGKGISADAVALRQERDELLKLNETLKTELPKMDKEAATKAAADYQARAKALDERIDAFNNAKRQYDAEGKSFDARIEAHNKGAEALRKRTDAHLDNVDDWKANCANKSYDEADEAAVKKELGLK